jgi:hypothetical protein
MPDQKKTEVQTHKTATLIQNHLVFHTGGDSIKSNQHELPPSFSISHSIQVRVIAESRTELFPAGGGKTAHREIPWSVLPGR